MSINKFRDQRPARNFSFFESNRHLAHRSPQAIVEWTALNSQNPILTTNFRPLSVALIHMVTRAIPDIPVIWIDGGYNTAATLEFASRLKQQLNLNLQIYRPREDSFAKSKSRDIPRVGSAAYEQFVERVKIEPFQRALGEWRPDFWLTGIRADQTAYRRSLEVLSEGPRQIVRVAPFLNWTEVDVEGYVYANDLPDHNDYYDPTKPSNERECGLQIVA